MSDILLLAVRVVAGGTLVVAFAMVSDMLAIALVAFATFVFVLVELLGVAGTLFLALALWLLIAIALYAAVIKTLHREPVPR